MFVIILTLVTVSSLKSVQSVEHGGDEFKTWPRHPGGWVTPSQGEVWPKPREQRSQPQYFVVRQKEFRFEVTSESMHGPCDILNIALTRLIRRVFPPAAANVFRLVDIVNCSTVAQL